MKRIDFEYYWTEDQPVNGKVYGVEEILEDADMGGIDHVVLIAGPIPNPNNSGLAEFVEDEPRLIGCCQINPLHGAPAVKELETAATVWGMPILKLMSVGCNYDIFGQAPLPVLDKARELELVVNIHSGARHKHAGADWAGGRALSLSCRSSWSIWGTATGSARRSRWRKSFRMSIWAQTRWREPLFIMRAVQELGPEKICFASNGPRRADGFRG